MSMGLTSFPINQKYTLMPPLFPSPRSISLVFSSWLCLSCRLPLLIGKRCCAMHILLRGEEAMESAFGSVICRAIGDKWDVLLSWQRCLTPLIQKVYHLKGNFAFDLVFELYCLHLCKALIVLFNCQQL